MGYFIASFFVGFFGFVLHISGIFVARQDRSFEENKRRGRAEVVDYRYSKQTRGYDLMVHLLDYNDGKTYYCEGKKIVPSKYPKGTIVDVLYARHPVLGVDVVEVHLLENPPGNGLGFSRVLKRIAAIMLAIAVFLAFAGIVTLL